MTNSKKPNVIIMYADDLGYGDLGCYGASSIPTPNLDQLAEQSLKFTDGYAPAATCTPSRYSLLTGNYPWRNENAHILAGDAPLIIEEDAYTLPDMFKEAGYDTGIVGKWHLGLGEGDIDWNEEIRPCPLDIGFDYSYIMAATNDRVPCVYIKGREVEGLKEDDPIKVTYDRDEKFSGIPTYYENSELLDLKSSHGHDMSIINGIGRIGYMKGGKEAIWDDEDMAEVFLNKATSFVAEHQEEPFFLYYALHQPHVPRVPGEKFKGSTEHGPRGDVIAELDWCVGQMLNKLEELGLKEDTIVIFTSDNGPVLDDGYEDQAEELKGDHAPAGPLRGGKYSLYDGGVRVPFMVRWPDMVEPGESSALLGQVDLLCSLSSLIDQPLPEEAARDSFDVSPALLGEDNTGRTELVNEAIGAKVALRQENWAYIPPYDGPAVMDTTGIETGNSSEPQLYNLNKDIGQRNNAADEFPDKAKKMSDRLHEILNSARTRSR